MGPDLTAYAANEPLPNVDELTRSCCPTSGVIHRYLWWIAQLTESDPWLLLGGVLPAATVELARRGWRIGEARHKPTIWSALVSQPGAGKSTALTIARDFYEDLHNGAGTYITAEGSMPGLYDAIGAHFDAEQGITAAVLTREEFSTLLHARRADDMTSTLCEWADGAHHERHTRSLKKARQEGQQVVDELKGLALSAAFATTISALTGVATPEHMEGGLFSRLTWFIVPQPDVNRLQMQMHHSDFARGQALEAWKRWQRTLTGLETVNHQRLVVTPDDAEAVLRETLFEDYVAAVKAQAPLVPNIKRGLNQAVKIAGVFALSKGLDVVSVDDMTRAVQLIRRNLEELEAIQEQMGTSLVMQHVAKAQRFIDAAGTKGVPRTKLYRHLRVPKRVMVEVLDTLLDRGSVLEVEVTKAKGAGRPTLMLRSTRRISENPSR